MLPLLETRLPRLYHRGKVRDTYDLGDRLLMIATDRISAYDCILPTGIPAKGVLLSRLSAFWFRQTAQVVRNHLVSLVEDASQLQQHFPEPLSTEALSDLAGRSMIIRKAKRLDVECVVRGYLAGSAWQEYQLRGTVHRRRMPEHLEEADALPRPVFTPTTKAEQGHDQPMSMTQLRKMVGKKLADEIEAKSIAIYRFAAEYALERGIIIADTKFEFGLIDGEITLIDELLTPDSSRFWGTESYFPGHAQPSFDKQYVRDWLASSGWNKEPPAPELPPDVVAATLERYQEAYRRLTGEAL
ncbi:MAG: phosphoribosylaminoimidazolesuccinocarboxamide synthase [Chloroflexi bacterium]|nr:phosphoribosylaminoimidazolesuccinocarboxamide synthase [Chloroflexota bacterium]